MRLPEIDPAGRVSNGTGRDAHASNPYIPRMGVPEFRCDTNALPLANVWW